MSPAKALRFFLVWTGQRESTPEMGINHSRSPTPETQFILQSSLRKLGHQPWSSPEDFQPFSTHSRRGGIKSVCSPSYNTVSVYLFWISLRSQRVWLDPNPIQKRPRMKSSVVPTHQLPPALHSYEKRNISESQNWVKWGNNHLGRSSNPPVRNPSPLVVLCTN